MEIIDNKIHVTKQELEDPILSRRIEVAAQKVLRAANVELLDPSFDSSSIEIASNHSLVKLIEPEIGGGWVVPD